MQTVVISIVTCDVCITALHACEIISHDANDSGLLAGPLQTARPTLVYTLQQLHLQRLLSRTPSTVL